MRFGDELVHPAGGTGVPGPAVAPGMRRKGSYVASEKIGFDLVSGCILGVGAMPDRIEPVQ